MILFSIHALLLIAAGFALFRMWRVAAASSERWVQFVIAAGFLSRALLGQALFWISWAHLPLLRSLQMGNGFWSFGQDGLGYFPNAALGAQGGLWAIVTFNRMVPSVMYVQTLAAAIMLFGREVAVAVLLNLFCYLGIVVILVRWSAAQPRAHTAAALAIAAISLSPALMLWSLQPLKDSLFQFLIVAFVAACAVWQRAWRTEDAWKTRLGAGALQVILLFAIAGIRWYFAFALLIAVSIFLLLVAFQTAARKSVAFPVAAALVIVFSQSLVVSAKPYIPSSVLVILSPTTAHIPAKEEPASLLATIDQVRDGFDRTGGGTLIRTAASSASPSPAPARTSPPTPPPAVASAAPRQPPRPPAPLAASDVAQIRALFDAQTDAWNRGDVDRYLDLYWKSPDLELDNGGAVIRGWEQIAAAYRSGRSGGPRGIDVADVRIAGSANGLASLSGRWQLTTPSGELREGLFTMFLRRFPGEGWKAVRVTVPRTVRAYRPPSRVARLVSGLAAVLIPRRIGEWLGLFHIGGGLGMFWFTELDTVFFDLILFCALVALIRRSSAPWRNPLTWLVLAMTLLITGPLVYSVSNFGTLFRLREMIYIGLLLTPLVVASAPGGRASALQFRRSSPDASPTQA